MSDVNEAGLIMLGGWMAIVVGVSVLREAGPLHRLGRLGGAAIVLAGVALAVVARARL